MSLVRHFPTPSDRMGIIWSALPIKESIVIEYGPAGTTHYGTELFMELGININKNLHSTHISEDDIVMGKTTRLKEAILEVDKLYNPKVIFVVGSSLTSVVASDINALCKMLQKDVNAKLISFEHGGFRGDFSLGIKDFFKSLKPLIKEKKSTNTNKYNILGATHDFYRIGSDIEEIKYIMKIGFNMDCECILPYESSVSQIENLENVDLNIVLREEALNLASSLKTNYIYSYPFGYNATLEFIKQIENIINKKCNEEVIQNILNKQKQNIKLAKQYCMFPFPIYLEGNYNTILGLSKFLKEELGLNVKKAYCTHSLKNIQNDRDYIVYVEEKEKLQELKKLRNGIIFGSQPTINYVDNSNTKILLSFPAFKNVFIANHFPFAYDKGADFIIENIIKHCSKLIAEFMPH